MQRENFEVWRYFEERADQIGQQLWSSGTWIMCVVAATLAADFIGASDQYFSLAFESRIPPAVVSAFGVALCMYSYFALTDLHEHMQKNWQRANFARKGTWERAEFTRAKRHGWKLLLWSGRFSFVSFFLMLLLALIRLDLVLRLSPP